MKTAVLCGLLLAAAAASMRANDPFADTVVSYVPGTGQNTSYVNTGAALGAPSSSATITAPAYQSSAIVGVGNGGELTLSFNAPILNDPADHAGGMDFTIFGNEFFTLSSGVISGIYNHTGLTVWVSQDNLTYYELAAPEGADDLFPTLGSGDPGLPINPAYGLSTFQGVTTSQAANLYAGSAGGASYSIGWAEDSQGAKVNLPSISYVKIEGTGGFGYVDAVSRVESIPEPGSGVIAICGFAVLMAARLLHSPRPAKRQ